VSPNPGLPSLDGLLVADLGEGEMLWAFGDKTAFVASSSDGTNWQIRPTPLYPARVLASYLVADSRLLVVGGVGFMGPPPVFSDVWASSDGNTWVEVGNAFPNGAEGLNTQPVALFAGELHTVQMVAQNGNVNNLHLSSADSGATWVPKERLLAAQALSALQPTANHLLLLNADYNIESAVLMSMDAAGTWSAPQGVPALPFGIYQTEIYLGCWWVALAPLGGSWTWQPPRFFILNRLLSGTTFTLAPATGGASA
jgi:hypothetical protein